MDKRKTILIVEDDAFLVDAYKIKLQKAQFDILIALDGDEALQVAKDKHPNLIILDINLPKKDGITVLKTLKAQAETKDIPVIIASNVDEKTVAEEGKKLGAEDYFVKSNISINDLIQKCETYLT